MRRHDWIFATLKLNWSNMMADRAAFWSLGLLMAVQNLIYFSLWAIVFSRISSLRGWGLSEIAFLFGAGAFGYGIFFSIFGGLNQLASYIHDGMLDIYLSRPRSVLLSVLMHRMRADSLGDVMAGLAMIFVFVRPPLDALPLIVALSVLAGIVFASFRLIVHALAFWSLSNESCENGFMAFLIAATNPQKGFGIWGKMILLTIFPAGYIGLLPVEILHHFDWQLFGLQFMGTMGVFGFALLLFQLGLARYKSGNKFIVLR